jgi:hypothetical protein
MTESPYADPYDSVRNPPPHAPSTNWGYGQSQGGYPPSPGYPASSGGYPAMPMSPGGPGQPMVPGGPPPPRRSKGNTVVLVLGAAGVAAILLMAGLITVVAVARSSDDDRRPSPATVAGDPTGTATPPVTPGTTGPSASAAEPDGGGGEYRAPQELCSKLDFAPLTAVFGGTQGSPSTARSEYDTITVTCGVIMRQGTRTAITTVSGFFVGAGPAATRDYEYQLTSAKNTYATRNGIREIPGVGEKAFVFKWDSSNEATATFQLWILDGNLTFSAKVLGSVSSGATWTKADEDKVYAALITLGTAALSKLKG